MMQKKKKKTLRVAWLSSLALLRDHTTTNLQLDQSGKPQSGLFESKLLMCLPKAGASTTDLSCGHHHPPHHHTTPAASRRPKDER